MMNTYSKTETVEDYKKHYQHQHEEKPICVGKPFIGNVDPFYQKHVLLRADFNVPLKYGHGKDMIEVASDTKIVNSLETIKFLLMREAKVVICSHLGRPRSNEDRDLSLQPVAKYLQRLLPDVTVDFLPDCVGKEVKERISKQLPKSIILLENLRFYPQEIKNNEWLAQELAENMDVYINDAFSACYREMASTCAITLFIKKKFLGFSLYKDLYYLTSVIEGQKPPVAAVIGGVKASSKMSLLRFLAYKVDKILIGGAMVFTFYKALDFHVGGSYVDEEAIDDARRLIELCKDQCSLILAPDAITIPTEVKKNSYEDAKHGKISVDCRGFPIGQEAMDVGNRTIEFFKSELDSCNTIFFNGPLGRYEDPVFAHGTNELLRYISSRTSQGATTVLAGSDTASAAQACGATSFSHISLGGSSTLMMLAGKPLPGVDAIPDENNI